MTIARACYQHSTDSIYQYTPRLAQREDMEVVWYDFERKVIVQDAEPLEHGIEDLGAQPMVVAPIIMTQRDLSRAQRHNANVSAIETQESLAKKTTPAAKRASVNPAVNPAVNAPTDDLSVVTNIDDLVAI